MSSSKTILFATLIAAFSCSRSMDVESYRKVLQGKNYGLTKWISLNGEEHRITYWPGNLVQAMGLADREMVFFEITSSSSKELLRKNETHFRVSTNNREYLPDIVFTESLGARGSSRLLVGFSAVEPITEDFHFQFLSDLGVEVSSAPFAASDIAYIQDIKLDL